MVPQKVGPPELKTTAASDRDLPITRPSGAGYIVKISKVAMSILRTSGFDVLETNQVLVCEIHFDFG
jgi:hypothetical protein